MEDPITLFVAAAAVCFGAIATLTVIRSVELTRLQKASQIALAWIIPLIGAIVVIGFLRGPEYLRRRHGIVIPRNHDPSSAGHLSEKSRGGEGGGAQP